MEEKVLRAATEELAESGVDSFSLRQVAKRSGVPRTSIFLRWPDSESLIIDAVNGISRLPPLADTGTLRGDLEEIARELDPLLRPPILALQHKLTAEAARHPRLYRHFQEKVMRPAGLRVKAVLMRALERGEIAEAVDIRWFVHAFVGALVVRTVTSPGLVPPGVNECQGLIELLLAGIGYIESGAKVHQACTGKVR